MKSVDESWNSTDLGKFFKRRRSVYREGEDTDWNGIPHCFKVLSGVIGLSRTGKEGGSFYVGIAKPEQYFGEEALTASPLRFHGAVALTEVVVLRVAVTDEIRVVLLHDTLRRHRALEQLHAEPIVSSRAELIDAHLKGYRITRTTLAQLMGCSRELISKICKGKQIHCVAKE